jgi:hypothetical protein
MAAWERWRATMGNRGKKKRPEHNYPRVEKFIRSEENWHPTVRGEVHVTFMLLTNNDWRVCVWGGDDLGMERDFKHTARQEAKELFEKLTDGTTMKQMTAYGMYNA